MKSVMMSIKPKWCEMIASGKKTLEIRKTRPKIDTPFKCYIYCTKQYYRNGDGYFQGKYCGKVMGEFVCDKIYDIRYNSYSNGGFGAFEITADILKMSCLDAVEIDEYGEKNNILHGLHISDLVIYDSPKELSDFFFACNKPQGTDCSKCTDLREYSCKQITRPPQNWCYVEETIL